MNNLFTFKIQSLTKLGDDDSFGYCVLKSIDFLAMKTTKIIWIQLWNNNDTLAFFDDNQTSLAQYFLAQRRVIRHASTIPALACTHNSHQSTTAVAIWKLIRIKTLNPPMNSSLAFAQKLLSSKFYFDGWSELLTFQITTF